MKNELQDAKVAAFKLLARKSLFTKELECKLKEKGFALEVIAEVLALCQKMGILNDDELQQKIVASELRKGHGFLWATAKCRAWIPKEKMTPPSALEEREAIIKLLAKKKIAVDGLDLLHKRKVVQLLLQRGFTRESIFEVLG
jgi:SOS response regulatory protein OraA/RecX